MRGLRAADWFEIERECDGRPLLDGAAAMLRLGAGIDAEEAEGLVIGQRDFLLLELRAMTAGRALALCDRCPACGLDLEVATDVDTLASAAAPAHGEDAPHLTVAGRPMRLRPATGADLRAALGAGALGRKTLAARCLVPLDAGHAPAAGELDAAVVDEIARLLPEIDPQSDLLFAFVCPDCGYAWTSQLDIVDYFGRELQQKAAGLIDDVHDLASHYHWSENAILDLPASRRAAYLARLRA